MIASTLNSFQGNLDTDGNEQYGEFFGGPSILDNADSEENDFADLMLDQDINWLVEAACNRLKSSPTLPQGQQSPPANFGNFIDDNIKSQQLFSPQQGTGVPSTISIDHKAPNHENHPIQSSSPQLSPSRDPKLKISPTETPEDKDSDPKIIMSKSMPVLKSQQESSVQASVEMSKTIDKKSVKGLLKGFYFEKEATASPYLQHLKKPNPLAGLDGEYALHKAVFAQKNKQRKPPKSENEKAQEKLQKLSKMKMKQPPKLDMKPFTPITSKGWEVIGIRRDQQVDNLYGRVESFKQQFNAPKTLDPIIDEPKGRNIMSSKPLSAKVFRTSSPSNMGTNNIDQIVSEQYVPPTPAFRPIQSPTMISAGISPPDNLQQSTVENNNVRVDESGKPRGLKSSSATSDEANRIDSMDMLANIHNDPLYRIIKEEMERIQKLSTLSARIPSRAAAVDPILPSHVKILSFFQSLPPSVWVTCRLVYFLIASYYETVILPPSFRLYREWTELEQFWLILDQHYSEFYLNLSNIPKQFSWTLLQDLLKVPKLFCKVLEVIEHGLKMSPEEWSTFHNAVEKSYVSPTPNSPSLAVTPTTARDISRPLTRGETLHFPPADNCLLNVFDDEGFRDIFYESFPVQAFHPLRDMVKAGRGFLLTSTSALFAQAGHGAPIVPGTPLAISVALTSWVKRVIAMLYIAGTQRVRALRSQQQPQQVYASRGISPSPNNSNLPSPIPRPLTATGATTGTITSSMTSQLPPNLSFACIFNGIPGCLAITSQDFDATSATSTISSTAIAALQRYLRFFGVAASLVKPSDQLEVLLHALPAVTEQPNGNISISQRNTNYNTKVSKSQPLEIRLQQEIEMYLRMTSSSPLHKVKRFDYDVQFPVLAAVRFVHPWMEALHPWLAYQILVQTGVIQPSPPLIMGNPTSKTNSCAANIIRKSHSAHPQHLLDSSYNNISSSQESFDIRPQTSPMAQYHPSSSSLVEANINNKVYDIVMAPFFNHFDAAVIEPLVLRDKAFLCDASVAQIVREKSGFSVALISEGKSSPLQEDEYGLRASVKGNRFVVAVSESSASWNAFQMVCRLAKESDTILLVYVPNLQPNGFTRASLTRAQYDELIQDMQQRRASIVQLYRTVGYNVLCASPPTYVDYARHVMETYITSNHLKTQAMQLLSPEGTNIHPYEGYAFYQQNMECRMMARSLLRTIQPLKPDFLILGADGDDILNALSYHYLHPHLAFKQSPENASFPTRPQHPLNNVPVSAPHENPYTHRPEHHHTPANFPMSQHRVAQDVLTVVPEEEPLVNNGNCFLNHDSKMKMEVAVTVSNNNTGTMVIEEQYVEVEGDVYDANSEEEDNKNSNVTHSNNTSAGRLLMSHGRVNSQLTMISALTETVILACDASNKNEDDGKDEGRDNNNDDSNGGVYDDDDFVNDEEDDKLSAQYCTNDNLTLTNLSKPVNGNSLSQATQMSLQGDCERAVVLGEDNSGIKPFNGNKQDALENSLDLNDLASFIIEDNDEGENSLSASPFLVARPHNHTKVPLSGATLTSTEAIVSDGRFTHPFPTPVSAPSTTNPAMQSTSTKTAPTQGMVPPVASMPDQSTLLRLQLFRDYARERLSFSDVILHELVTRIYWWPDYIRDELMQRERRAKSLDPTEKEDPSIALVQCWMHEPVSCILAHLPTTQHAAIYSAEDK